MAEIGKYFVHEAAIEAQKLLDLQGVGSRLELQIPNLAALGGGVSIYVLIVDDRDATKALSLISVPPIEDHDSMLRCPACDSTNVIQANSLRTAMAALIVDPGPELLCLDCEHRWSIG